MRAIQVQLACNHFQRWDLKSNGALPVLLQGDELFQFDQPTVIYCKFDGDQFVTRLWRYEWHVKCGNYRCAYGRWVGQSEDEGRRLAARHKSTKGADHTCIVVYDKVTADGRGEWFRTRREGAYRPRSMRK